MSRYDKRCLAYTSIGLIIIIVMLILDTAVSWR